MQKIIYIITYIIFGVCAFISYFQDVYANFSFAFCIAYVRSHEPAVSAKSGSRNNNPSHMTENYLKVARPTFREGKRMAFFFLLISFFFLSQDLDHVVYVLRRARWNTHCNNQTGTMGVLFRSNESGDPSSDISVSQQGSIEIQLQRARRVLYCTLGQGRRVEETINCIHPVVDGFNCN